MAKLTNAYDELSKRGGGSEMIIISGSSGAGKFQQLQQTEPLSAIISAFSCLCNDIISKDAETLHLTRKAVKEVLGTEGEVLANLIPNFHKIVGVSTVANSRVGGMNAQNRLIFAFKLFVRAISKPTQPLLLFLDDMQWADSMSLELITSLITDNENNSLLLIGTHRDNEVSEAHPLSNYLRGIETKCPCIKLRVDYLDRKHINELISDTLGMLLLQT
eukprot:10731466-Ditylum_brightwellii.AAC.1